MSIRESTTSRELHKDVRSLMKKFWKAYDKLYIEMDGLTENEFFIKQHEMWEFRNKASTISGDMFLISLWGMSDKAEKLYGKGSSWRYIEFINKL